jgi:hypothetical protein
VYICKSTSQQSNRTKGTLKQTAKHANELRVFRKKSGRMQFRQNPTFSKFPPESFLSPRVPLIIVGGALQRLQE